jgi:archaellum component FlaC
MKLAHNLGKNDEGLDIDINDHVDNPHELRTLHNILRSFQVKNNQVILMVEKTNTIGTYRFLYHENMEKYMVDLLSNIDEHNKYTVDWDACDNHYRLNSCEKVTPYDLMRNAGNSSFWISYADGISAGPTPTETVVDLTKPPERRPKTIISYAAVVKKQSTKGNSQNNQSVDTTTTASTISGDSGEPGSEAGIDNVKRKLAEIDTHRDNYEKQQQKAEEEVSTLTEAMHKMATYIINLSKDMNGLSSQMKEIKEILKQQNEIKISASNSIKSPPRQRRRTGNTGSGSVSPNDDTIQTWGSDCDSEMEDTGGKVVQNQYVMDTIGKWHGGNKGELTTGEKESTLEGGSTGLATNKWKYYQRSGRGLLLKYNLHSTTGTQCRHEEEGG